MRTVVSKVPEIVAAYPRQTELEETIINLVKGSLGIKETDLWLQTMATMPLGPDHPPLSLVAGTVRRMIRQAKLVGVDYSIGDYGNTLVLPANAIPTLVDRVQIVNPDKSSSETVLHLFGRTLYRDAPTTIP